MLTIKQSIAYHEDVLESAKQFSKVWLDSYRKLAYFKGARDQKLNLVTER